MGQTPTNKAAVLDLLRLYLREDLYRVVVHEHSLQIIPTHPPASLARRRSVSSLVRRPTRPARLRRGHRRDHRAGPGAAP